MEKYIPKSKINILQTTGMEFIVQSTGNPYKGTYIELSDGTFFTGNNPNKLGKKLIRKKILNNSFGISSNNSKYRRLKKPIHEDLSKVGSIPPSKPNPTINDLKNGYFIRYFCRRINEEKNYFEINKETYTLLINKDPKYDSNLYTIGSIKWNLIRTSIESVEMINKKLLNLKSMEFPFIETLFTNLNEYEPPYTEGNEFTIGKNQTNYIGYYHSHPEFGYVMEGAFHVPTKHKRLFKKQEKIDKGATQTMDRSTNQTSRVTTPTRVTSTPVTSTSTPRVTPSRPSYGGGGGY